jgi:hypothetical protein
MQLYAPKERGETHTIIFTENFFAKQNQITIKSSLGKEKFPMPKLPVLLFAQKIIVIILCIRENTI